MFGLAWPELAADEDDVEALRDQERGEAVPERVEGELFAGRADACAFEGGAEVFADVAVVEAAPLCVALAYTGLEDEVMRRFEGRGEPALAEELPP
jgi:hypothetical protein